MRTVGWPFAFLAIAIGVSGCSWRSHRSELLHDIDRQVFVVDCVVPFNEEQNALANTPLEQWLILRPAEKHAAPFRAVVAVYGFFRRDAVGRDAIVVLKSKTESGYEYVMREDLMNKPLRVNYVPLSAKISDPCEAYIPALRACSASLAGFEPAQIRCYYMPLDFLHLVR